MTMFSRVISLVAATLLLSGCNFLGLFGGGGDDGPRLFLKFKASPKRKRPLRPRPT